MAQGAKRSVTSGHVAQQHLVEVSHLGVRRQERRQRRTQRLDRMAQVGGEGIAVARRSGRGIGDAARGEDHLRALLLAFETAPVDVFHTEDPVPEGQNLRNTRIVDDLDAVFDAELQQGVGDVPRLAALRKDPVAAFDVEFHACAFEKLDRRPVVELRERDLEKFSVGAHLIGEFLGRTRVGDVASSLAGDADLAARLLHLFDQQHAPAAARRRTRGHHARSARPDDDHVERPFFFQLFHTGAKIGKSKLKIKN